MPHLNDDDFIPDPNHALFSEDNFNPKLIMQFMSSVSQSVAQTSEGFKNLTNHMDSLTKSVDALVQAEMQRQLDAKDVKHRFELLEESNKSRKEDIRRVESKADKSHKRIDDIELSITSTCDITTQSMKTHTKEVVDAEVKGIGRVVKATWAVGGLFLMVVMAMTGIIYGDIKEGQLKNQERIDKIIEGVFNK